MSNMNGMIVMSEIDMHLVLELPSTGSLMVLGVQVDIELSNFWLLA